MSDIFHTFFGISGLSLLGYFKKNQNSAESSKDILDSDSTLNENKNQIIGRKNETALYASFREIDPTYALPSCLVEKLGLFYQKLDKV